MPGLSSGRLRGTTFQDRTWSLTSRSSGEMRAKVLCWLSTDVPKWSRGCHGALCQLGALKAVKPGVFWRIRDLLAYTSKAIYSYTVAELSDIHSSCDGVYFPSWVFIEHRAPFSPVLVLISVMSARVMCLKILISDLFAYPDFSVLLLCLVKHHHYIQAYWTILIYYLKLDRIGQEKL